MLYKINISILKNKNKDKCKKKTNLFLSFKLYKNKV